MGRNLGIEADRIVQSLKGRWHGHYAMCRCPAHNDRSPSLKVTIGEKAVLFHCYAGCSTLDVLAKLPTLRSNNFTPSSGAEERSFAPPVNHAEFARILWERAIRPTGPALQYLQRRHIQNALPVARYLPRCKTFDDNEAPVYLPALILPLHNSNGLAAIQRIFLSSDGHKASLDNPKRMLGIAPDATIRVGQLDPKETTLNLAEGFEDAASVITLHHLTHCWAVCGIERYRYVAIPEHITRVNIWTQHGKEAEEAIKSARFHLESNGRLLTLDFPPFNHDWNSLLCEQRDGR